MKVANWKSPTMSRFYLQTTTLEPSDGFRAERKVRGKVERGYLQSPMLYVYVG